MVQSKWKVLILILSTNNSNYQNFIYNQKKGWVKEAKELGIDCYYYSGGHSENVIIEDEIKLNCEDNLNATAQKLLLALEQIENNNLQYTHIYRTNLSSYIFPKSFLKYYEYLHEKRFYAGVVGKYHYLNIVNRFDFLRRILFMINPKGFFNFASGSGFFLSKDLVKELINPMSKKDLQLIDDVMVGKYFRNEKIVPIRRFDWGYDNLEFNDSNCFHVRLKTKSRENDSEMLTKLASFNTLKEFLMTEEQ